MARPDTPTSQRFVVRQIRVGPVIRSAAWFFAAVWLASVVAGVVLWQVAAATGLLGNVESFWAQATGQASASFSGIGLLLTLVIGGLVTVVVASALTGALVWLLNTVWGVTGGLTVDGDTVEPSN